MAEGGVGKMNCIDCGTKLSDGICPNCQEELHIYNTQIYRDGTDIVLSDDFVAKVKEQKVEIVK